MYTQIYLADVLILVPGRPYCCARSNDSYEHVCRYICVHVEIFGKSTPQYCCVRSDDSYEYIYDQISVIHMNVYMIYMHTYIVPYMDIYVFICP